MDATERRNTVLSIRVTPDTKEILDERCVTDGKTRSEVVRALLEETTKPLRVYAWVAYYEDLSGFNVFSTEMDALRHAVAHNMSVIRVPLGMSVNDAIYSHNHPQKD